MNRRYYRQYDDFAEKVNSDLDIKVKEEKVNVAGIPENPGSLDMPSFVQVKDTKEQTASVGEIHTASAKPLNLAGIFDKIETEDIVIIAMIFLLLMEPEQDSMLILILGFLFISKFL